MSSSLSPKRSESSAGRWDAEPSVATTLRPVDLKNPRFPSKRPSRGKRAFRALARFLITLCIGVAATLAWQSYGDAAREMIASSSPRLGWLAPPVAQSAAGMVAPAAPTTPSPDQQQVRAMSAELAAVRQSLDRLGVQLAAGQEQMARHVIKLQAGEQDILDKISAAAPRPAAAPAQKPVTRTPALPPAPR